MGSGLCEAFFSVAIIMVLEPFMASTTHSLLMSTEYLRPIERAFRACTLSGSQEPRDPTMKAWVETLV